MTKAELVKSKTIVAKERKRKKKLKRKVKLYAEVEFSAQGYDAHLTSRQDATGPSCLLLESMFHLSTHHKLTTWRQRLHLRVQKIPDLGCMRTHIQ